MEIIPKKERKNEWKHVLRRMRTRIRLHVGAFVYRLVKNHIYTVRFGLTRGLKRKGGLGFVPQILPPTHEEKFLTGLDLSGQTIYDIGGAEGLFTIFFGRAVGEKGKVVAFEPNQELHNKLIENVMLNKFNHVEVRQIALGKERKKEILAFHPLAPTGGSIQEWEKVRILQSKTAKTVEVEVDSIDHQIAKSSLPKPDFIKIDVQGVELDILLGMSKTIQKHKPKLFIEIHASGIDWKTRNLQRVIEFLIANGYLVCHVESGEMITLHNAQIVKANEHLYCT